MDRVGLVLMALLGAAGLVLFLSGFRFFGPLDAAVRFGFGGACAAAGGIYLWYQWRRHRRKRAMIARVLWTPSHH